jgi:hypothetical protein
VTLFDIVAKRRLDATERVRHDAFRREIRARWRPCGVREHVLELRAEFVHTATRLFGGGPTLLQVTSASGLIALGTLLRVVAPAPNTDAYAPPLPDWARIIIVLGMVMHGTETFLSPRRIRTNRTVALVVAVIPAVQFWVLVAHPFPGWPHWPSRLAWTTISCAITLLIVAVRSRRQAVLRAAIVVAVTGAGALALAETTRTVLFTIDDDPMLAVSCALTSVGAAIIAAGLTRTRVELAP